MCYSPDGGDRNQGGMLLAAPESPRFDCDFDDYFDSAPEPGEYSDSHWNLGSPLNRFIAFGGPAAPAPTRDSDTRSSAAGASGATSGERGDWRHFGSGSSPGPSSAR